MDNIRFALLCALGVIGFFLWQSWQADYGGTMSQPRAEAPARTAASAGDDLPAIGAAPDETAGEDGAAGQEPALTPADQPALPTGKRVRVVTDKLDVVIDTRGGDLRRVALRGVPVSNERPEADLRLLNERPPNFFIAQSGLIAAEGEAPDHRDVFGSPRVRYELADGQDTLEVPLTWTGEDGRRVTKRYRFERGSYRIGLTHEIVNGGAEDWSVSQYVRFWRTPYEHGEEAPFAYSFMGVGWHQRKDDSGYRFEKVDFEDLNDEPLEATQTGGWLAMMQHYFVGAVVPTADETSSYFARPKPAPEASMPGYAAGYVSAQRLVAPGASDTISADLFVGPKIKEQLDALAPGLQLTVDYGMLTFLAEPLFWVLDKLHAVVGNWGWAIVLLTVIIKLAFYKLSETQYRSMARMRKFAPRIQQIKEQYGDDREMLQKKMMALYKEEGFNPLGGCWPMLVQMPVFIALYWVLRESVELRHAEWMLWINDLSSPDPYYILPVIFGVTMFLQQKLSSSSMAMDPMQQRMMQVMPVALSVFFAFFPAGLVLYWLTNNLLSIAQQWYIYRKLDTEDLGRKAAAK